MRPALLAILFTFFYVFSFPAFSVDKKKMTTKDLMGEVFQSFVNLLPYAASEMKFSDPSAGPYIVGNISKMMTSLKNANHLQVFKKPSFRPSFQVAKEHLEQTLDAFHSNNKIFSRTRLKATAQICMSCHSQLGGKRTSSTFKAINDVSRTSFQTDLEYAEFLFLIRDYRKATRYYEQEIVTKLKVNEELRKIHSRKNTRYTEVGIEKSFQKILEIYTKISYRPDFAISFFSKFKKRKDLSKDLKRTLGDWIGQLQVWRKKNFSGAANSEVKLQKFIGENLKPLEKEALRDDSEMVTLLISSGVLYRFMSTRPKSKMAPEVLYWLSKIDRRFSRTYFYSLADLYLKQCIIDYSKNPFAKKCYKEYEESITLSYTGSAGVDIPKDEKENLAKLKAYLKN